MKGTDWVPRDPAELLARPSPPPDRKQRRATLGAVALPTGPTIGQSYLARVSNRDLRAADTAALRSGIRRR
jgi:hypothetical protein